MPPFPPFLQDILARHDFHPRKRWGQNFLVDDRVMQNILDAAELQPGDVVLEIGPGLGALTTALAQRVSKVFAVELDVKLCAILREVLVACPNVELIQDDIIHVDLKKLLGPYPKPRVKVVANLPYYVTTPIIMNLLESHLKISSMVIMVQKEVADRMAAPPGGKEYGSLSVAVQYYCRPKKVRLVSPGSFVPAPAVTSAVVRLDVYDEPPVHPKSETVFFDVVHAAFAKRRKMLSNALQQDPHLGQSREKLGQAFQETGIDGNRRGETLGLEEFCRLSDALTQEKPSRKDHR